MSRLIPGWRPPCSPHPLRHAAGTVIGEQFGWEHVKAVLGHSQIQTSQRYVKVDEKRAEEVVKRIG